MRSRARLGGESDSLFRCLEQIILVKYCLEFAREYSDIVGDLLFAHELEHVVAVVR